MATLPGRCVNDLYCTVATSRDVVSVPAEGRFVCPNCSKTLVPPNTPLRRRAAGRSRGQSATAPAGLMFGMLGLAGGILLGGLVFHSDAIAPTPLSDRRLSVDPVAETLVLTQPGTLTVGGSAAAAHHRRHVAATLADAVVVPR
jgi:hypothetical protein